RPAVELHPEMLASAMDGTDTATEQRAADLRRGGALEDDAVVGAADGDDTTAHGDTLEGAAGRRDLRKVGHGTLLRLGRAVRLIFDAERVHHGQFLAPMSFLLVTAAPFGDLLPLGGGAVERLLRRLALGQRLGDLEGELSLVLVGGRYHRVRYQEREARLHALHIFALIVK